MAVYELDAVCRLPIRPEADAQCRKLAASAALHSKRNVSRTLMLKRSPSSGEQSLAAPGKAACLKPQRQTSDRRLSVLLTASASL